MRTRPDRDRISCLPQQALSVLLVSTALGVVGCGDDATVDAAPSRDSSAERIEELALEARQLQEETAEAGRRLVEEPGERAQARARLRELAGEARDLGQRVRREVSGEAEARAVRRATERVERGAEQLLTFSRSERGNLLVIARDSLNEADQELDGVANRLDARLGEDARTDLEALRREVPELPEP